MSTVVPTALQLVTEGSTPAPAHRPAVLESLVSPFSPDHVSSDETCYAVLFIINIFINEDHFAQLVPLLSRNAAVHLRRRAVMYSRTSTVGIVYGRTVKDCCSKGQRGGDPDGVLLSHVACST